MGGRGPCEDRVSQWSTHPGLALLQASRSPLYADFPVLPRLSPSLSPWAQISPEQLTGSWPWPLPSGCAVSEANEHMSLTIQRPMAQLNLIKLINLPKGSPQKPLTQFKVSPPQSYPNPWLPAQASLIRTKSLIPTGAIGEFWELWCTRGFFYKMISGCTCTERLNMVCFPRLCLWKDHLHNTGIVSHRCVISPCIRSRKELNLWTTEL